ncbi:hypothetical protein ACFU96_48310 [Streptomyces sp. NPDC057620]|uniref:hypothetical protein n=1 Tax=Streptomyces sp. NPDC057620 TaxID=3346185 RepID=UPI0036B21327
MIKRIAWALVPLVTAGLASFAPFLYLMLTRKTARARTLFLAFTAATALEVVVLVLVGNDDVEGTPDLLGGFYIVALAVTAAVMAFVELRPAKESAALPGRAYL